MSLPFILRWIRRKNPSIAGETTQENEEFEPSPAPPPPTSLRWTSVSFSGFPRRQSHAAAAVGPIIYSIGGFSSNRNYSWSAPIDVFCLNTALPVIAWQQQFIQVNEDTPLQRKEHTAVVYNDTIYLWGGRNSKTYFNTLYKLNSNTLLPLTWEKPEVTGEIPKGRAGHSAVVIRSTMYIFGGYEDGTGYSNDVVALDLVEFVWSSIITKGNPPTRRTRHTATVYKDRYMLIFGGDEYLDGHYGYGSCNTFPQFDVETNKWAHPDTTGKPPHERQSHTAFLHNNSTYIYGGYNEMSNSSFNDLFRFDPGLTSCLIFSILFPSKTMAWSEVKSKGKRPPRRWCFCCVAMQDRIFIFGGEHGGRYFRDTFILEIQ